MRRGAYLLMFNYLSAKHVKLKKGQRFTYYLNFRLAGDLVHGSVSTLRWRQNSHVTLY